MAAKEKITVKVDESGVSVNGIIVLGIGMLPQTGPGVKSFGAMANNWGMSDTQIDNAIGILFASLVSSKGMDYVKSALAGATDAAKRAKADIRAASNRDKLDEFNAANRDRISDIASELDAARAMLAAANARLESLRKDACAQLDVDWTLDVQLLAGDDGHYLYVPSDALGAKPGKKSKGSGMRRQRVYDYSKGQWSRVVKAKKFRDTVLDATITWTASVKDGDFTVKLEWAGGSHVANSDNMSTAGQACYAKFLASNGVDIEPKDIPLNLPSVLKVDWSYA